MVALPIVSGERGRTRPASPASCVGCQLVPALAQVLARGSASRPCARRPAWRRSRPARLEPVVACVRYSRASRRSAALRAAARRASARRRRAARRARPSAACRRCASRSCRTRAWAGCPSRSPSCCDDAGRHLVEVAVEFLPRRAQRHRPESGNAVTTTGARSRTRVVALVERARRRERDEVRHVGFSAWVR